MTRTAGLDGGDLAGWLAEQGRALEGASGIADVAGVRALLVGAAREGRAVSYTELLGALGHRFTRPKMRALCKTLDAIDAAGAVAGEPPLAVLVVRESDGLPGQGRRRRRWSGRSKLGRSGGGAELKRCPEHDPEWIDHHDPPVSLHKTRKYHVGMFSLAYVILPFSEVEPAEAIASSLARFQMGGRGDIPDEWLRFHDDTARVEELYRASITFTQGEGLRAEGADSWHFDTDVVRAEMDKRGKARWQVRFLDIEPTIASFAARYLPKFEQHPITAGFGHWRNPLGRWDWWDLGGGYDGVITDMAKRPGRARSSISSGPSRGRAVLEGIEDALADALDQDKPLEIDVASDNNVELVSRLRDTMITDENARLPGALVLPPGFAEDADRWIGNWPEIGPPSALAILGVQPDAPWRAVVRAAYDRLDDCWAAGVAFHH